MSYNDERYTIENYLLSNWSSTDPQIEFPNNLQESHPDLWVRVTIQSGNMNQASLGEDAMYRVKGVLFFQIFCKPNTGEGDSLVVVDKLTELFKSKRIGDILFYPPALQRVGVESNWYQINLTFKYQREE